MRVAQQHLEEFWRQYKLSHGSHEVFREHPQHLRYVIPMLWHGDEGRGVRRGNTTVSTIETPFGLDSGTDECYSACQCCTETGPELWRRQNINLKGHSYLTKFLMLVLPKKYYKNSTLLQDILIKISTELRALFYEGIEIRGQIWHVSVVGLKGDLAWFQKIGELDRCYTRLSTSINAPCCHECMAGSTHAPFEDLSSNPAWASTIFTVRPWITEPSTGILKVPYDRLQPEKVLKRDLFHCTKIGVYQDFIAGAVLLILELGYFQDSTASNSREKQLERAHGHFRLFCAGAGKSPALMSFTTNLFNVPTRKHYGWCKCKGSDAMILMQWIRVLTTSCMNRILDESHRKTLKGLHEAASSGVAWVNAMYRHGLWWARPCAEAINAHGKKFLRSYNFLAWVALHEWQFPAFAMKPKIHLLAHEVYEVSQFLAKGVVPVPSCLMFSCEMNEDVVGRISRLSRRAHQARVSERVLNFYLTKVYALYKNYRQPDTSSRPQKRRKTAE